MSCCQDATAHDQDWIQELINLADNVGTTWRPVGLQLDGIEAWHGPGDDRRVLVRSQALISAHPGEVWAFLTRVEDTLAAVDRLVDPVSVRVIDHHDPQHKSVYCRFQFPPLYSDRDAVWLQVEKMLPDGSGVVVARSIETPEVPEDASCIRAHFGVSGYVIRPFPGAASTPCPISMVTHVFQFDPKFKLPHFIENQIIVEEGRNLVRLRASFGGEVITSLPGGSDEPVMVAPGRVQVEPSVQAPPPPPTTSQVSSPPRRGDHAATNGYHNSPNPLFAEDVGDLGELYPPPRRGIRIRTVGAGARVCMCICG